MQSYVFREFFYSQLFLPTIAGFEGYCCTWEHAVRHTHTHTHTRQNFPGQVLVPTQRPLPYNTQRSEEHPCRARIRTHNPRKRAAVDTSPRPRGFQDGLSCEYYSHTYHQCCWF